MVVTKNKRNIFTRLLVSGFALLSLILFGSQAIGSQESLLENNIGKLVFTSLPKQIDEYSPNDFVSTINLNSNKNLYFAIFLAKPLSFYLAELAPELSKEAATNAGNFQFSFYVNDALAYTENLNLGAGTFDQKSKDTLIQRPFYSEQNEDSWGRFLWMRFMHFGGEESLTEGRHELRIEVRPYVKLEDIKVGSLIASGSIEISVIKPTVTKAQMAVQPIQPVTDWAISQDNYDQTKIQAMNKRIIQKDFKRINSIVVIKKGELLIEQYFNGANRTTLHNPRSVGKSFASTVLGIAIDDGYIDNADQTLSEFYELKQFEYFSAQKAKVSLRDLVTMNSGFQANDSDSASIGNEENMYPTEDWVKFALDLPMAPQEDKYKWQYFTAGVVLLGDILHQSVPNGLEKYAHEKLFTPLGITSYQWQYTPQNVANTAGGIQLRALDFAKYGQLYKNRGVWKEQQIVSSDWIAASLAKQVQRGESERDGYYGYLFWNDNLEVNGKVYEVAYAAGNGGNKIFIFKELPLVVVITASAYGKSYAHKQVNQMMRQYILPAVLD